MLNQQELLLHYIDECMGSMRRAPDTWGSPESLELQALQLMELRSIAVRPVMFQRNHREMMRIYHGFVAKLTDGDPSFLLSSVLSESGRIEELPEMLSDLYAEVQARLPPEDLFRDHDIVLELSLDKGSEPRFSAVCAYYENFQKAMRNILRATAKKTGKSAKDVKDHKDALQAATEYIIPEFRVVRDEEGTKMQVSLLQPNKGQLTFDRDTYAETSVRKAIADALSVTQWASQETPNIQALHEMFPDDAKRKTMAVQALRIIPEKGVREIRVGGRLIGETEPVKLTASQAIKLVPVLKEGESARQFSHSGTVRAIDLDQKWFRLRYNENNEIRCWVPGDPDALLQAAAAMSRKERIIVIGDVYRPAHKRPFVDNAIVRNAA